MTMAHFSTVLDAPIEEVWSTVRDFGVYEWAGSQYWAIIEDDQPGDAVGSIRRIGEEGAMRQQLVELSDVDHRFSYVVLPGSPIEVDHYRGTLSLRPVVDTRQTFIEWTATFDCTAADAEHWRAFYAEDRFPAWLAALRARVTG